MNRLIVTFLVSIANSAMCDSFTYNIQQAGYDFDQYDEKGEATYEIFIDEFRAFPWSSQVGKSNGGSEATISVQNHPDDIVLWVSVIGETSEYAHLIGVVYKKEKGALFGIGKPMKVNWVEIYLTDKKEDVENSFRLFFNDSKEELFKFFQIMPLFHEQETAK